MKTVLHRLIWKSETEKIHPLSHVFFFITLVFGIGFTFFGGTAAVQATALHATTTLTTSGLFVPLWGIAALLVTVFNTLMLATRKKPFAYIATFGGYSIWLFAALVYLMHGFWFQFFAGALPNLAFWTWYYINVKRIERQKTWEN